MKCRPCGRKAVIGLKRHNTSFCEACFVRYVKNQVDLAINKQNMFGRKEPIAVAVSGGKDSLGLWHLLSEMGIKTRGLHVNLGIGDYSDKSEQVVRQFAEQAGLDLLVVNLRDSYGWAVTELSARTMRTACSACGLVKRYLFNNLALSSGFAVIATGHNLDDEAASLLGNVLHWNEGYLNRQGPVLLSTHPKLVRKVKPLFRLTERETAAYCLLNNIDYIIEECPLAKGSTSLRYKESLNLLERHSPGTKHSFYLDFLRKQSRSAASHVSLNDCDQCGHATTGTTCAFCRLLREVQSKSTMVNLE